MLINYHSPKEQWYFRGEKRREELWEGEQLRRAEEWTGWQRGKERKREVGLGKERERGWGREGGGKRLGYGRRGEEKRGS